MWKGDRCVGLKCIPTKKHMSAYFRLPVLLTCFVSLSAFGQEGKDPLVLGEKFMLKSEILKQEREILVSLPPDYEAGEKSYPVHFILDAEITFEAYSGVVHLMHLAGQIPDAIVVGIPNIDRNYDLDFLRNGSDFLEFITRELIPVIDSSYRTKEDRLMAGYSVAGNYVMYAFFTGREYFSRYLSGSPYGLFLFYAKHLYNLPDKFPKTQVVYTSMGKADLQDQFGPFQEFCQELDQTSIEGFDFKYEVVDHRNHETNILPNWYDGLAFLYKDWNPQP